LAAVVSVQITTLSVPVKHGSLTEARPALSVAWPAQVDPDDSVKPPLGPQELTVVAGRGGCGCTCKHPAIVAAIRASIATILRISISIPSGIVYLAEEIMSN